MARLGSIIEEINSSVNLALDKKQIGVASLFGVSELIPDTNGLTMPVITDLTGDGKYAGYDDVKSVQLYHRIFGSTYRPAEGVGNQMGIKQATAMLMIVAFKIDKIRLHGDDLEALIVSGIPSSVSAQVKSDLGLRSCGISITGSTHDTPAIFAREYKGHQYTPDTNMKMFEIRYQVECNCGKDCINTICCP